ncbi:uncharacterized protein LTHEOB_39 [Lasiodiplodia theobromae]|uniref:uncharacterized protein n=1 Tax=Lasiodiplodia theobromae TaxID=45133 RepID=UPI0015C40A32|nr:uncharacterized protein LTHEOB_39 [Lasiodiplodia theobromae]KAF4543340.1 hypothetical protein LTHEOB_39 [Lasiodiplodia theobromae]
MVLQPVFGLLSDRCSTRWGQRKPFILCGAVAVAVSITGLAWAENTASFLRKFSASPDIGGDSERVLRCVLAFIWIWVLNISIQSAQMGIRTSIVESCSREQQGPATAWSGVAVAVGNLCGYLLNTLEINRVPMFGAMTPFQSLIFAFAILPEKRYRPSPFYSWMAWFPVMYYQTRYVADLYYSRMYSEHPWMGVSALVGVHEDGVRMASGAAVGS